MQVITRCKKRITIPQEDLLVHLDASKGVNGGTASNGDSINTWEDQSGNGNHFVQASGALQPTLEVSGINGKPTIDFTAVSYLQKTGLSIGSTSISLFIVLKREGVHNSGGYGNPMILSTDGFAVAGSNFLQINEGISGNYILNTTNPALDRTLITNSNDKRLFSFIKSPTTMEYYVDGSSIGTNTGSQTLNSLAHYIGAWGSNYFNGYISEIILYNKELTSLEVIQVNNYLTTKYAI